MAERINAAVNAMKEIGISSQTTKTVLRRLLKVYDNNWEYIEDESYRVLADSILEFQDNKVESSRRNNDDDDDDDDQDYEDQTTRQLDQDAIRGKKQAASGSSSLAKHRRGSKKQAPMTIQIRPEQPIMPVDDLCGGDLETPIAVIHPPKLNIARKKDNEDRPGRAECLRRNASARRLNESDSMAEQSAERMSMKRKVQDCISSNGSKSVLASGQDDYYTHVEVASSAMGKVKLLFAYNSGPPDCPDIRLPSIETVCKSVENQLFRTYRNLEPEFSLMSILNEMCECALGLGFQSARVTRENMKSNQNGSRSVPSGTSGGSPSQNASQLAHFTGLDSLHLKKVNDNSGNVQRKKKIEARGPESSNTNSLELAVVQHPQVVLGDRRTLIDVNDIANGEERVRISLKLSIGKQLPSFHYIPHNIIYQNAHVNISLARIGDEDCCSDCFGDCLMASIPCACARVTGGEYAYSSDGLLKNDFLDACVNRCIFPQPDHYCYCQDCPIERIKNEVMPEPCKGHLLRKFIKECWNKCGCNKKCGNRVVQRGITCNLQVFYTREGKGWGLRTLDELPKGMFVCEYVGEILTNMELYERTMRSVGEKHTYPVTLDADWGTEGVLRDEESLCLDGTYYGNVARFINHRCSDPNLAAIPVAIETSDHHYYHLAFFTSRNVEAYEELTWDYGMDFDDDSHPIEAFQCACGSKYCRDRNRNDKTLALVWR